MSQLVHLKSIAYTSTENLSSLLMVGIGTCKMTSSPAFTEINIVGLVDVTIDDEYENNQKVFTTKATFKTCCHIPANNRKMAFLLTSVTGEVFLIGTPTRPYPIIKESTPFPGNPQESALKKVTITWKSLHPMLSVTD